MPYPTDRTLQSSAPFALLIAITMLTGCGGGGADSDTAAATAAGMEDTGAAGVRTLAAQREVNVAAKPPKLKRRPDADAQAWEEHRKAMKLKNQSVRTEHRGCTGAPTRHGDCLLEITPVEGAHLVDTTDVDTLGYVIAKIRNTGGKEEAFMGIPARETVFWRVYRRVERDASGQVRPGRLVTQLIVESTGKPIERPQPAPAESPIGNPPGLDANEFPFTVCSHDPPPAPRPPPPTSEDVKWRTCAEARLAHRVAVLGRKPEKSQTATELRELASLMEQIKVLRTKHNSPAWITCPQSCCSVEGP